MKKAIVVLYSPKTLYDFIWYYCTYGKEYEWTAICIPYGYIECQVIDLSKKLDIFEEIKTDASTNFSIYEKLWIFIEMLFFFCIDKRKAFCKYMVKKYIKSTDFFLAVVPSSLRVLTGAIIGNSDEYNTVILEDGLGDYHSRTKKIILEDGFNFKNFIGAFIAKLGYASLTGRYWLEDEKYCEKYSSHPEKMKYFNYRCIKKLHDMTLTDTKLYYKLISKTFEINDHIYTGDLLLFTAPLIDFTDKPFLFIKQTIEYINKNFPNSTLLIKRHPRDNMIYEFTENIKVKELDEKIPAEVLSDYIEVTHYIFMFPSATLLAFQETEKKATIFYYKKLEKISKKELNKFKYKKIFELSLQCIDFIDKKIENI